MAARRSLIAISLPADPVNPLEAATKQYVDAKALTNVSPANVDVASSQVGTGTAAAREDHKHMAATGVPSPLGASGQSGASPNLCRQDHIHPYPGNLSSSGTTFQLRLSTDGGIGTKPTDVGLIMVPNPPSAHASWNGSEYALIGCYPTTQDVAVWNNLRVMTTIYAGWTTPKSAQVEEILGVDSFEADHFGGDGIDIGRALAALVTHIVRLEARIAALEGTNP